MVFIYKYIPIHTGKEVPIMSKVVMVTVGFLDQHSNLKRITSHHFWETGTLDELVLPLCYPDFITSKTQERILWPQTIRVEKIEIIDNELPERSAATEAIQTVEAISRLLLEIAEIHCKIAYLEGQPVINVERISVLEIVKDNLEWLVVRLSDQDTE